jgi:hypothetical protein
VAWTIPGHHPLSGTKHGSEEVLSFFDQLGKLGSRLTPIFLEAATSMSLISTGDGPLKASGQVDTTWALVWHFGADGKFDRVGNLSGDQHQMNAFIWPNLALKPLPDRLA